MNIKKIKIILNESARSEAAEYVGKTLDDVTFGMRKVRQANRAGDAAALQKAFDDLDAFVDQIYLAILVNRECTLGRACHPI